MQPLLNYTRHVHVLPVCMSIIWNNALIFITLLNICMLFKPQINLLIELKKQCTRPICRHYYPYNMQFRPCPSDPFVDQWITVDKGGYM